MTPRVGILAQMGGHGVYNVKKSWSSFALLLNLNDQWMIEYTFRGNNTGMVISLRWGLTYDWLVCQ